MSVDVVELIRKKRDGLALAPAELRAFIDEYTAGAIPDYQAAAWLMAVYFRGLTGSELAALTDAMLHSGDVVDLSSLPGAKVDKHSTGGVGDKISLPLAPAVAACGVRVPMVSGRGLGHTGGTLDKLESIPGFRVDLSIDRFREVLADCGLSLIGQTARVAPADKKLYALRDVTGTVESIPLIAASIMSKKLAEGIDALVLDVKVGAGAFMKTRERARELGRTLVEIGRHAGKRASALITDMSQPLGRWVGNAVEVEESLAVLEGRGEPDLVELTVALGGEMLRLAGKAGNPDEGRTLIARALADGSARARFQRCVELQGGDLGRLPRSRPQAGMPITLETAAPAFVSAIDAEQIGLAALRLGAGRARKEDAIDPSAFVYLHKKVGESVAPSEPVAFVHGRADALTKAAAQVRAAYRLATLPPAAHPLILETLRDDDAA